MQPLPSSQGSAVLLLTQPLAGSQLSAVHALPSSQSGAEPPTQDPPLHVSPVVHALSSLQGLLLLLWVQPLPGSQPSVMQTLLLLQLGAGPPAQPPPLQASAVVHAFPSLHGSLLSRCVHPVTGLQPSSVHAFESSQFGDEPDWHLPATHCSTPSQTVLF